MMNVAGGADPAEINLQGSDDEEDEEGAQALPRQQEADVPRSDVLPLLLALETDDLTIGLGRQVPISECMLGSYRPIAMYSTLAIRTMAASRASLLAPNLPKTQYTKMGFHSVV